MSNNYWADRMAQSMAKISNKSIKQIEKQLSKYYLNASKRVIADFEATLDKVVNVVGDDMQVTPADLYKLERYWEMQAQLKAELQKLGNKEIKALAEAFETNFFEVYYSLDLPTDAATIGAFNTIDKDGAIQLINSIWCADGKSWSERIWDNTSKLAETLNEALIEVVVSGADTKDLKMFLKNRFNVSYSAADALVRTEIAHIQTEAAKQRYKDSGIEQVEIWADEDERRCEVCGKLHQTKYAVGANVPIPAHPRCRCCIIPVID